MKKNKIEIIDRIKFCEDKHYNEVIENFETLYWSGECFKKNNRGKIQNRSFILTDKKVVNVGKRGNFLTNLFSSLIKRQIKNDSIQAITYSKISGHFIIHVPTEYDYYLITEYKDEFLLILLKLLKTIGKIGLPFFNVEQVELMEFCQIEGEENKKWPIETPEIMTVSSFEKYITHKQIDLDNTIRQT